MMKKLLALILVLALSVSLIACGAEDASRGNTSSEARKGEKTGTSSGDSEGAEIALIIDIGTIDDKSFNQGSWEGLTAYAEENNKSFKYYRSAENSTDAYLSAVELAVNGGAKVIVAAGYLFEEAVFQAQTIYPEISFVLIDGVPHDAAYNDFTITDNVVAIAFKEEEAGFLAGYSIVKDGKRKLGFMGGMATPPVIKYGYGFVQGAQKAAEVLGLSEGEVEINYSYSGVFEPSPEIQTMSASWYLGGTEVIFSCGGAIIGSVLAAAEQSNGIVIGVDVDQATESNVVVTSAMKHLAIAVYDSLTAYYNNTFKGGINVIFDSKNNGIGLPMETSRFESFSVEDYAAIYSEIQEGAVQVTGDILDGEEVKLEDVPQSLIKVTLV